MNFRKTALLLATITTVFLTGCAARMNPIGEAKFDCNRRQDPNSLHCRSFRAVDQATDAPLPPSRFDQAFTISDMDRLTGISPDSASPQNAGTAASKEPPKPVLLPHQIRNDPPLSGQPVREGPVVQRVWIKRHVDGRDVLTEDTLVYREVTPTRWAGFPTRATQTGVDAPYPRRLKQEPAAPTNRNDQPTEANPEFIQPRNASPAGQGAESATDPAVIGSPTFLPN